MYITKTKTLLTTAMKNTLDGDFIAEDFRNINVSINFPVSEQDYPGVWVDFDPVGDLEVAGIGHQELRLQSDGSAVPFARWRFQGNATFTVVAMSSLERDRLVDEVIRIFAFGSEHSSTKPFRAYIEDNPLIAMNMDFGTIGQRGFASSPGTPWGTDEIIYEGTLSMNLIGEFLADQVTGSLIPISDVNFEGFADHEELPDAEW